MTTESVYPMLVVEHQTGKVHAQLFLRNPPARGRFHAFFADAVGHLAGNLAYGITWGLCGLLELGDPGPRGSAEVAASLPSLAEVPVRAAELPAMAGKSSANRPGLEIGPYPAAARQVTSVVQPGAYRGL